MVAGLHSTYTSARHVCTSERPWAYVAAATSVLLVSANLAFVAPAASADTAPPAGVAETVTADPLPTAQIDGVVWAQAIAGNTVYVGGEFTTARPAGAAPGVNTVPRANLMAYNLTTGEMTSWNPGANAKIKTIVASPDGTRIYVGGSFTTIAGQTRNRIAAFDASTGALLSWAPYSNAQVNAIAATAGSVFIAGDFSSLAGGARTRLGSVAASNGALLPLQASLVGGYGVQSLVVDPTSSKLVVAGSFESANGSTNPGRGMAALDAATGASMPWAVNSLIRNGGTKAAMTALASDGDSVYGTGYDFGGGPEDDFEGTFRARWSDGSLVWLEDCHGDNYSVAVSSGVVYTSSHDHYCGNVGGFPQAYPSWTFHHSLAFAKEYRGSILTPDIYGYKSYTGRPAGTLLHWYPNWQIGTYTGKSQATWDVVANDDYVLYGGEFPRVNNKPQQGLVRFAKKNLTSPTSAPEYAGASFPLTATSLRANEVRLSWQANTDRDNATLTYQVFRQDRGSTPIHTSTAASNFWTRPRLAFVDTTAVGGQTYNYRVRAVDPHGNQAIGDWTAITATSTNTASAYSLSVVDDGAIHYWPLAEHSGTSAADLVGGSAVTVNSAVSNVTGPNLATPNKATQFSGASSSFASTTVDGTGINTFTIEAWFKTSSTAGGKIAGFGNSSSGNSSMHDRHIYINGSGRVSFGVYPGTTRAISSGTGYNNGQWHHVVGALGPTGMTLWIDRVSIGTRTDTTSGQNYEGYWRIGGDSVGSWPNAGSSYLNGSIADVAIYNRTLVQTNVDAHWVASGRAGPAPTNQPPVAAFTTQVSNLGVSTNGSASSDSDGSVASYGWAFGDGATGSQATASHTYAAAGTYTVTLTVTDDRGATDTESAQVTVSAPPPAGDSVFAQDGFGRALSNGWGAADRGGVWTTTGSSSGFAVTGGAGRMTAASSTALQADLRGITSANSTMAVTFSVDKVAAAQYVTLVGRRVGASAYTLRLRVGADGAAQLYVLRDAVAIGVAYTVPGLTIAPGTACTIEFEVRGTSPTTLNAKMWRSADPEPMAWQIVRTDSTAALQAGGSIGVSTYVPASANAFPLQLSIDNLTVTDPTLP